MPRVLIVTWMAGLAWDWGGGCYFIHWVLKFCLVVLTDPYHADLGAQALLTQAQPQPQVAQSEAARSLRKRDRRLLIVSIRLT